MKSTGIVRKVDGLGRVVLPKELRRTLGVDMKDSMEIYTEDNCIILNWGACPSPRRRSIPGW